MTVNFLYARRVPKCMMMTAKELYNGKYRESYGERYFFSFLPHYYIYLLLVIIMVTVTHTPNVSIRLFKQIYSFITSTECWILSCSLALNHSYSHTLTFATIRLTKKKTQIVRKHNTLNRIYAIIIMNSYIVKMCFLDRLLRHAGTLS